LVWRPEDPEGQEVGKVRHILARYTRGRCLDLGAGPWPIWPNALTVDDMDEWKAAPDWRPDIVGDVRDLSLFADRSFDSVFSSHVLEHIEDTEKTLREWWRVVKVGGHLTLYLPHRDHYPRMGQPGSNNDHKHDFAPEDIVEIMAKMPGGWDLVENQTRTGGREYSFLVIFQKKKGSGHDYSWIKRLDARAGKKAVCVIRFGGIGDVAQITSVFPWFHENGWHVTFMTSENGEAIVKHDPNVDEIWAQDTGQVPDEWLLDYWQRLGGEFDKVVNLCEAVEGTLLGIPGRRDHALPHAARALVKDVNYHEMIHAIAGAPLPMRQDFYHTPEELAWARDLRAKVDGPVIVYCPMGTSVHKLWPHCGDFFSHIIDTHPTAVILSLGGKQEQQSFERPVLEKLCNHYVGKSYDELKALDLKELAPMLTAALGRKRFFWHAGLWDIRQTAAFLRVGADVIVGPETGMMNIAASMDVAKVLMLSHSSHEMLSKYWTNTIVIPSSGCIESPCRRMHYDWSCCYRDDTTKAAVCAAAISGAEIADIVLSIIKPKEKAAAE